MSDSLTPTSTHGPCTDGGALVRDRLPGGLPPRLRDWVLSRLDAGEQKYGEPLRIGWSRAGEALMEEIADAICYAVALDDESVAGLLCVLMLAVSEAVDHE